MSKLKQTPAQKAQFATYAATGFQRNKLATMLKTLKTQPNNKQLDLITGFKYTRSRKSSGHKCKGLCKELGFVKNMPNGNMLKSKLPLHYFYGAEFEFNHNTPNHGKSMGQQLQELGYVRKHKKTTR